MPQTAVKGGLHDAILLFGGDVSVPVLHTLLPKRGLVTVGRSAHKAFITSTVLRFTGFNRNIRNVGRP